MKLNQNDFYFFVTILRSREMRHGSLVGGVECRGTGFPQHIPHQPPDQVPDPK